MSEWLDDPRAGNRIDWRPMNDAPWSSDKIRTTQMARLEDEVGSWWAGATEDDRRAYVERIVISTVREIASDIPGLPADVASKCRAATSLEEAGLAIATEVPCKAAARAVARAVAHAVWLTKAEETTNSVWAVAEAAAETARAVVRVKRVEAQEAERAVAAARSVTVSAARSAQAVKALGSPRLTEKVVNAKKAVLAEAAARDAWAAARAEETQAADDVLISSVDLLVDALPRD